jgi:predicted aspartyl protease
MEKIIKLFVGIYFLKEKRWFIIKALAMGCVTVCMGIISGIDFSKGDYGFAVLFLFISIFDFIMWTVIVLLYSKTYYSSPKYFQCNGISEIRGVFDQPIKRMCCPVRIKTKDSEVEIWCLIDTGFTGWISVSRTIGDKLGLESKGQAEIITSLSKGTADTYYTDVKIGNKEFKNVQVFSHTYLTENEYEQGVIGIQFLSHGKLLIEKEKEKFTYSLKM